MPGHHAYDALIAFTAAEHNATLLSLDQRAAATYETIGAHKEQLLGWRRHMAIHRGRRARCRSGHLVRGALLDAIGRAERDGTRYREHYGDQLIHNGLDASGSGPASCCTQTETGDAPPSAGRGTAAPASGRKSASR
jgi:hypothetical protein